MTARGIRNNNPGNIRHSKDKWQGMADEQKDSAFVTFKSPEFGIRAIARVLLQYQKRGLDTVGEIIRTYAPPSENDTNSYIKAVCRSCGVLPDDQLNLDDVEVMLPLVKAIIKHETGSSYPDNVVMDGLRLAGISGVKPKPLAASRTIQGGTAVTVGTGIAAAGEITRTLRDAQEAVQPGLEFVQWLTSYGVWVALAVSVVGCGWLLWARYSDRKRLGH
jgi:hypothetical protein